MSSVVTDGNDGQELKIKSVRPTFSLFQGYAYNNQQNNYHG